MPCVQYCFADTAIHMSESVVINLNFLVFKTLEVVHWFLSCTHVAAAMARLVFA